MRSLISPKLFCALAVSLAAGAQSLQVYSEFTRTDPFGNIVPADRGEGPREILSPALPRNAVTAFHLVVSAPAGMAFNLYIGQNPEDAAAVTLYRETYTRSGSAWIPDGLEQVSLPYRGHMQTEGIPGQTSQAFWLDLRVAAGAEVRRIKIEPQVSFEDRWVRYPMEARIVAATAPATFVVPAIAPPPVNAPADFAARRIFQLDLCRKTEKFAASSPLSIRDMIARDAAQDMAIASGLPLDTLWNAIGAQDRVAWCKTETPDARGPEWYLGLRDRILNPHR